MHGSSSVPQEFIDLVNKYGGAMPNAKGVPEDQISMAVRNYGVCKVNIDTEFPAGNDGEDSRGVCHQAGGV